MLKTAPVPRYYQLRELIRQRILSQEWPPGMQVPSERELGEQYGLSRMTVRQSVYELVKEGLLFREQGKGTFVAQPKITQQLIRLTGFTQDIQGRHQHPGTRVLSAEMWPADEDVASFLRIKPGQLVFRLRRLRLADGAPLALEMSLINFIGCEQLLDENLQNQSLYAVLGQKFGLPPYEAEQELEAGLARPDEAELLDIAMGSPVLLTRRTTYTDRQQPIEYAKSVYRGDKYKFYARLVRDENSPNGLV